MSSILALSVSDKIEQYGAYAGFASVLGLAVLSLLYFAQARELKRLREWAGRAPERANDLQAQAVAAAQQRVIAQPQRAPVAPGAVPPRPGVPAAATPAGQATQTATAPAAAAAATAAGAAAATPGAPPAPGAQPTTVQPAANGAAATPPTAKPGEPLRAPAGIGTPRVGGPESVRTNYGPDDDDDEPRSRLGLFAALGALAVVVIVLVVLLTGVLGGSGDKAQQKANTIGAPGSSSASTKTTKKKTSTTKPTAAPTPGSFEVAVLNATATPGLARGVANRLQDLKYKIGTVTNAADQTAQTTSVLFAAGHRAEADLVAKSIQLSSGAIKPLDAGSKTIAGETATVVVTVGADQNVSPQTQTQTTQ